MELRPLTVADLASLDEIDATIDSDHYLHLERLVPPADPEAPPGPATLSFTLQDRRLRERLLIPNRIPDETRFLAKQIVTGGDEGIAHAAEHDDQLVAVLLAQPDPEHGTIDLRDLRVDFDVRRQGLGLALLFQLLATAREREIRAVRAEVPANNYPAIQLLRKTGFELAGLDTQRHTNHDLVKERVTLVFYAALD